MSSQGPPWDADAWLRAQQQWLESLAPPGGVPAETSGPRFELPPMFGLPALGITRERQEAWERLSRSALRLTEAQRRIAESWSEILRRASAGLGIGLTGDSQPAEPANTVRSFYDRWVDAAEQAHAEIAHAPPYVEAQAELTNATIALKIEQRAFLEQWAREYDLPTRTELNALHRRVKQLASAVRALEKRVTPPKASSPRAPRARSDKPTGKHKAKGKA